MDTTNCSVGFATDVTFVFPSFQCHVSLITFDIICSIVLLIRFASLVTSWHEWIKRKEQATHRLSQGHHGKKFQKLYEKRIPIIPSFLTFTWFLWILMFILIRYNISTYKNGLSFLFWVILFDCYAYYSLNQLRKIVNLGNKVIPQAKKFGYELNHTISLDKFDFTLKLCLFLQISSALIQTCLGLVGLVYPGYEITIRASFLVEGFHFILNSGGLCYQLERLINVVKEAQLRSPSEDKIDALNKMRSQQFWWALWTTPAISVQIMLFIGTIPLVWEIVVYWILIETTVSSFTLINSLTCLCYLKRKQETSVSIKVSSKS